MSKMTEDTWKAYMKSNQEQSNDWKDLLADDVSFEGPAMQVKGKNEYIKTTEDFFQMVRDFQLKRYIVHGDLLATQVEIKVATPKGNELILDMAEFYQISNEKISSVKVYYDATYFRKEFDIK